MSLLVLYVPLDWSFISIQFFVLSSDGWFFVLSSRFIIFESLIIFYTKLNSSIICCLFSGDIYLSFGISLLALSRLFFVNTIPLKKVFNAILLRLVLFYQTLH